MIFHHMPGILFSGMLLGANLHENIHIQEIAFWFLAGACVSCICGAANYTLSLDLT